MKGAPHTNHQGNASPNHRETSRLSGWLFYQKDGTSVTEGMEE